MIGKGHHIKLQNMYLDVPITNLQNPTIFILEGKAKIDSFKN